MNREYKVGDLVIYIDKDWNVWWKNETGVSLYGKIAKIIKLDNDIADKYLLEFIDSIKSRYSGNGKGKKDHCIPCERYEFKSINHLKFKKWLQK